MKIRIKGNTIRYRLDKKDIECLEKSEYCEESTQIMDNTLKFIVRIDKDNPDTINFKSNKVEFLLNKLTSAPLFEENKDGVQLTFHNSDETPLHLTIERDFKCLVPRGDDDRHGFTHPQDGRTTC